MFISIALGAPCAVLIRTIRPWASPFSSAVLICSLTLGWSSGWTISRNDFARSASWLQPRNSCSAGLDSIQRSVLGSSRLTMSVVEKSPERFGSAPPAGGAGSEGQHAAAGQRGVRLLMLGRHRAAGDHLAVVGRGGPQPGGLEPRPPAARKGRESARPARPSSSAREVRSDPRRASPVASPGDGAAGTSGALPPGGGRPASLPARREPVRRSRHHRRVPASRE